jgi:hypothetical protein
MKVSAACGLTSAIGVEQVGEMQNNTLGYAGLETILLGGLLRGGCGGGKKIAVENGGVPIRNVMNVGGRGCEANKGLALTGLYSLQAEERRIHI